MLDPDLFFNRLPHGSRHTQRRLDNGLRLIAIEVPTARWVRLVGAVGAGYLDEPTRWPGLAHLLEHLLFLRSAQQGTPGDFSSWVTTQGGRYNARTGDTTTDVHVRLPPSTAAVGVEKLIDLLTRPALHSESITHEIGVIDAEFRARLADPTIHRQSVLSQLFHPDHPASRFHHGHQGSLGGDMPACRQALSDFHGAHYRAERMGLTMLGPHPLDDQIRWLTHAGCRVVANARPQTSHCPRWDDSGPHHVQWQPPSGAPNADTSQVELFWPLPEPQTTAQAIQIDRLAGWLNDGQLAATLGDRVTRLDATGKSHDTGPVLALTLDLHDEAAADMAALIATCQARVTQLASDISDVSERVTEARSTWLAEPDLDHGVVELARRQVQRIDSTTVAREEQEIRSRLTRDRLRILERRSPLSRADGHTQDTLTPWRIVTAKHHPIIPFPARAAPRLAYRPVTGHPIPETPACLPSSDGVMLWQGSAELPTACCLSWPADSTHWQWRAAIWRQRTLALRQVATVKNMHLSVASDHLGDTLIAKGDPALLSSLTLQAIGMRPSLEPSLSSLREPTHGGLIAQRLLDKLDDVSTAPTEVTTSACGWLTFAMGTNEISRLTDRLHEALANAVAPRSTTDTPCPAALSDSTPWPRYYTPVLGDDNALMLQIDGPRDDPAARLLMSLLASCHDAAFHHDIRRHQELGYAAAVRYRGNGDRPRLGYVVQSPKADIATLQVAVQRFLTEQGIALANLDDDTFLRHCQGLRSAFGPPETPDEALLRRWQALRLHPTQGPTPDWQDSLAALDHLNQDRLIELASQLAAGLVSGRWWIHAAF
ncbi:insulinase family protein [Aidingimonas lacisalsi]|uniref:insulinase family protein n=1 Tax=Aidingimonas lacisalsi TaxID=2604086 RepID=UPI0011D18B03|nr:insulinase family protein [Aidingimonas lacisalsi]